MMHENVLGNGFVSYWMISEKLDVVFIKICLHGFFENLHVSESSIRV